MAELKQESAESARHRQDLEEILARAKAGGVSQLGRDLEAIRQQAIAEGEPMLSEDEIDQRMNESRRRQPWQ